MRGPEHTRFTAPGKDDAGRELRHTLERIGDIRVGAVLHPGSVHLLPMFLPDYRDHIRFDSGAMTKVNLFESHRMFADLYCLRPGQGQRPHTHEDNDKLYLVLEGEGTFDCGGEERPLGAGGACVAHAGEPHGVRNAADTNLVILVVMAPHPKPPVPPQSYVVGLTTIVTQRGTAW